MNPLVQKMAPSVTKLIRMDHAKVLAVFHKYQADAAPGTKQALANTICLSLEIHAQLEEEIFYPAMRAADPAMVEKSVPEHDEMRRLISELRALAPTQDAFDDTLMMLMRTVIHHVADEETMLLPEAERLLADRLGELGAQMTQRKIQLAAPHAGDMAMDAARAMPASTVLMSAGALLAGSYLLKQVMKR
jgi:hemerythrin superfamily protein